jgi:Tfp pilus assembly protein PilZ
VYLVTAFVPSEMACLDNSPGKISLTADWTYLDERVLLLLNLTNFEPSFPILSKVSWMKEFMMFIAFFEIPISGWTCFKTL